MSDIGKRLVDLSSSIDLGAEAINELKKVYDMVIVGTAEKDTLKRTIEIYVSRFISVCKEFNELHQVLENKLEKK